MRRRSKARDHALRILYQLDLSQESLDEGLVSYFRYHRVAKPSHAYVEALVRGTLAHRQAIDKIIAGHAVNWHLHRMAVIDRNILRLGTYELVVDHDVPPMVVINEAVDLAKRYGTPDSGKFVNGILDKIHKAPTAPTVPHGS